MIILRFASLGSNFWRKSSAPVSIDVLIEKCARVGCKCVNPKGRKPAHNVSEERSLALAALNSVLAREGWAAFYDEHGIGQIKHIATNAVAQVANPHRPFTPSELERREQLVAYLDGCSEDELIEDVLLPLCRSLASTGSPPQAIRIRRLNTARTCG